ncbi:MAG: hypothetical protein AAFQ07_16115, partial [Chloroflexota bacterium]
PHIHDIHARMNNLRSEVQTIRQTEIKLATQSTGLPYVRGKAAFRLKVLNEEIARVRTANEGNRNDSLFYAALRLANYSAGGEFDWTDCESLLMNAALSVQTPSAEAQRTINSAWRIGSKHPKVVS